MVDFALDEDHATIASSENELDETMEDVDENEVERDGDADEDDDEDDEMGEDEDGEDEDDTMDQSTSQGVIQSDVDVTTKVAAHEDSFEGPISMTQNSVQFADSLGKTRIEVRLEALMASLYDIVPTIAAPQSTSINALAATPDMRFWFTGGSDCYIRKYDGVASINGKTLLTVAQRHPFVESVTKAAVLMNYWDNEEPKSKIPGEEPPLSPVYSLAVQSEALWILSGLDSGSINLYSARHDEGYRIAHMHKHKSAVSAMKLASDEKSVLSGSWDKTIYDWDLSTGQIKRSFEGSGGQISAIEIRPTSNLAIPQDSSKLLQTSDTFSSRNYRKTLSISLPSTINTGEDGDGNEDISGSHDSLFGGSETNSLFGETGEDVTPLSAAKESAKDAAPLLEVKKTVKDAAPLPEIKEDIVTDEANLPEVKEITDVPSGVEPSLNGRAHSDSHRKSSIEGIVAVSNGLPLISTTESQKISQVEYSPLGSQNSGHLSGIGYSETQKLGEVSESTFLTASMDGALRIWDKRQRNPVVNVSVRTGVPPWCMSACWSPDGNFIYAGRRNGTVDEYNLHKGLKSVERCLKFPLGSGPVTAIRAMPNSKHLICASHDILRLYDLKEPEAVRHSTVPFLIVPGPPRPGVISALHVDPTCRYMLSAAGNRGWEGSTTEVLIGYEIGIPLPP